MVDFVSTRMGVSSPSQNSASMHKAEHPDISKDLERLLWTEMLKYTGLEKSVVKTGGEGASSFARFMIEAIAEDIAEQHPLGISQKS